MKPYAVLQLFRQAKAQQAVIGPYIQEFATLPKQSVRYAKKVLVVFPIYHNQPQESIAHIRVSESVISNPNQLQRIFAS